MAHGASPDPFFESEYVTSLNCDNYLDFIQSTNLVAVMFYDDLVPDNFLMKKNYPLLAESSQGAGRAFAAVNCLEQEDICISERAYKTPMLKIFAGNNVAGSLTNVRGVDYQYMKSYLETLPVVLAQQQGYP